MLVALTLSNLISGLVGLLRGKNLTKSKRITSHIAIGPMAVMVTYLFAGVKTLLSVLYWLSIQKTLMGR